MSAKPRESRGRLGHDPFVPIHRRPVAVQHPRLRVLGLLLLAVAAASTLLLTVLLLLPDSAARMSNVNLMTGFAIAAAAGACGVRAVSTSGERLAWSLLTCGLLVSGVGSILVLAEAGGDRQSGTWADIPYLIYYPLVAAALWQLNRSRIQLDRSSTAPRLDMLIGMLALGTVTFVALTSPLSDATHRLETYVSLMYPLGDALLLAMTLRGFTVSGWHSSRSGWLLALGLLATWGYDVAYLNAGQEWSNQGLASVLWPLACLAYAGAAWARVPRALHRIASTSFWPPVISTALVLGSLVMGTLINGSIPTVGLLLAMACLGTLLRRLHRAYLVTHSAMERMTRVSRTDPLTGLRNRRALNEDLLLASSGERFLIFDLNGFKIYNDTFGHPAGDALLQRLGRKLHETTAPEQRVYRLGGDEFCVLLSADSSVTSQQLAQALRESGEEFEITASCGESTLGSGRSGAEEAMRLADQRLYVQKEGGRSTASSQIASALIQGLYERTGCDLSDPSDLITRVGRLVGLEGDELSATVTAGRLRDIGLVIVPDHVRLRSDSSPLSAEDQGLVRTHPIAAQRILSSAPALERSSTLVRSVRERWDGSGYPDGLTGDEIPLGSRVVAVCGAWLAARSDRGGREPLAPAQALQLLRERTGYYDPRVIDALERCELDRATAGSGDSPGRSATQRTAA